MPDRDVPDGSVVITPGEVYNEVRDLTIVIRDLIASDAEDKRNRAREELERAEERRTTTERFKDLDRRLGAVEKKLIFFAGAAATIGAGAGSYLSKLLGS